MSWAWEPGDVALRIHYATDTYEHSLVVEADRAYTSCPDGHPKKPHWHHQSGGWNPLIDSGDGAGYVPLVIIDPGDREQVAALLSGYLGGKVISDHAAVTVMQGALRSLIAPPKPEEPTGLGAVVMAYAYTSEQRIFVRTAAEKSPWHDDSGNGHDWSELDHVDEILSEGVAP